MTNFKFMKPYPLFRVEYEELSKGEDTTSVYRIYVKIAQPMDWMLLYTVSSLPWAQIALKRLKEIFDLYIIHFLMEGEEYFPMFEVNNQIYKTQYAFPEHSCICGEQIAGNQRYGEFSIDYDKFDYIREIVFFYRSGTCLVKGNQLFLDGELLADSTQLKELCDNIGQSFNKLDSSPEKMIKYIRGKYSGVTCYKCNGYTSLFGKGVK